MNWHDIVTNERKGPQYLITFGLKLALDIGNEPRDKFKDLSGLSSEMSHFVRIDTGQVMKCLSLYPRG